MFSAQPCAAGRSTPAQLDLFEADAARQAGEFELPEDWKLCGRCTEPKPVLAFHRDRRSADRLQNWCKTCKVENQRFRRSTPWGQARTAAYDKRSASRPENRQKTRARRAAADARRRDQLPKPDRCAACKRQGVPLQDDHYLGYDEENWEKVAPLCLSCDAERQSPMRGWALTTKNYALPLFPDMDAAYWASVERQVLPPCWELP